LFPGWQLLFGETELYWSYDYGHDLDPNAAIKIPGMTYQPPLIGSKQLLNIKATSLPDIGFYISVVSIVLAGYVFWSSGKK